MSKQRTKSTETPTDVTPLPVTSEKQRTVVYLLHCGLRSSLKSFNFLERLRLPHKVQSVEDSFPECSYFIIPILLLFQSLQRNHTHVHRCRHLHGTMQTC